MPAPIRAMQPEFGGDSLIAGSLANVGKGAKEMFTGQPERGVGRAVRPFAPGGAQINNTLQTVAAARGAHAVDLDKDQITQILVSLFLGGPYATGPGRDVIDKYSGSGPSSGSAPTGQRSGTSRTGTSRGGASRGGQQR